MSRHVVLPESGPGWLESESYMFLPREICYTLLSTLHSLVPRLYHCPEKKQKKLSSRAWKRGYTRCAGIKLYSVQSWKAWGSLGTVLSLLLDFYVIVSFSNCLNR
jgi:hypothetical protein